MYKSAKRIRKEFIDYFSTELDHKLIPSSSVIPWCDSSVPFVNAGMNQFKGIFLGYHDPPASKITNYQKCIRVGGKHNDLNDVGHDTYHHTFFEMLGNWSFGAYGKEAACNYAWNTLTKLYGIDKNNLYVTYFGGDQKLNIDPDFECREIWRKIGLSDDKIRPCSEDNFWEMDLFGPCGPCTEIHIDRNYSPNNNNNKLQQKQADELTELWNIVFINHQRLKNGSVVPLERQFIDTGMGFERLVAVLQNKKSNYDTDIFQPLFQAIHDKSHAPVYRGKFGADDVNKLDTNYRILADHARMITVALADGMIPEKNQKLRRVLRRALTIAIEIFKADNLLSELNYHVAESLGDVYPEIIKNLNQIQIILNYEKDLLISQRASAGKQWENLIKMKPELAGISDPFAAGLINAYKELQTIINNNNFSVLPGKIAFKFYDTYGLDLEAIKELAEIEGLSVDEQGFHDYFESVKINSRIGSTKNKRKFISPITVDQLKNNNIPKTNDSYKYKYTFDNKYKFDPLESSIVGVIIDGNLVTDKIVKIDEMQSKSGEIGLVLDKTSFYANEGGQLSDKGVIKVNSHKFNVTDVEKSQDYVIHYGNFDREQNIELRTNDKVIATIDGEYRTGLMMNHTATHLLNAGLRKIFPAIAQRASVVTNRDLIFKFSTYGIKFMPQHRLELDSLVNKCINKKTNVETKSINMFELANEKNLTLIPGEVYPDTNLRIVNIQGDLISKEACCGTHVHNTGVLENFSIIDVTPKSSSQYIIKAVTKSDAKESNKNNNDKNSNETTPIKINYLNNVESSDDKKKIVAAFMKSEIEKALENKSGPYIVHCLESNDIEAESVPLQKAVDFCNLPMFLIVMSKKKLKVRCFVPKDYQSSPFNAELWMDSIKKILPIKLGSFQDEDPLETCHTKILKIPRDKIKNLTDNAVAEAEKFASLYFKSKINKK